MAEEAARADEEEGEIHEDQNEELRRDGESGDCVGDGLVGFAEEDEDGSAD